MAPKKGSKVRYRQCVSITDKFSVSKETWVTDINTCKTGIWEVSLNKCGSRLDLGYSSLSGTKDTEGSKGREEQSSERRPLGFTAHPSFFHMSTLHSPIELKFQVPKEGCNSKGQHGKCGIKEDAGIKGEQLKK